MFGRKTGFLAAMTAALLLFGGCGTDGTVTEEQARGWYNEMTQGDGGTNSAANDTNGDGYGNYTGGPNWGTDNTERNTYGMRTDNNMNAGTNAANGSSNTLGQDIRNAWDSMTGNDNAGGNTSGNAGQAGSGSR